MAGECIQGSIIGCCVTVLVFYMKKLFIFIAIDKNNIALRVLGILCYVYVVILKLSCRGTRKIYIYFYLHTFLTLQNFHSRFCMGYSNLVRKYSILNLSL